MWLSWDCSGFWLAGFLFQYGTYESDTKKGGKGEVKESEDEGRSADPSQRIPSAGRSPSAWNRSPPIPKEMERRMAEVGKLEEVGRSPELLPTQQLAQIAAKARPSMSGGEKLAQRKLRPTVGDKAPQKEFQKAGIVKRSQRYWPEPVALCKICQVQKSMDLLIQKLPSSWLVHEIAQEVGKDDMCFQVHAILTLQEAAEAYLVGTAGRCQPMCHSCLVSNNSVSLAYPWRAPSLLNNLLPKVCFSLSVSCRLCGI